jgi:zinc protease
LQRDDTGYYASQVFNQVFAAGPSARLLAGLRTRRALVYSASGGIGAAYDHPGVLSLATTCRPEVTAEVIEAILEEIRALLVSGVSRAEVDAAREALLNSFVFRFDTQEKVLRSAMELFFYGRPADSADRYRAGIESVTPAQVDDVARRCLSPERLAIAVVGDAARFDRPLAEFGPLGALE